MIALADTLGIAENCPSYEKIREQRLEAGSVLGEMIPLIGAIYLPSILTLLLLSHPASQAQADTAGFLTHPVLITAPWRGIGITHSVFAACSTYVLCKLQFAYHTHTVLHTL